VTVKSSNTDRLTVKISEVARLPPFLMSLVPSQRTQMWIGRRIKISNAVTENPMNFPG